MQPSQGITSGFTWQYLSRLAGLDLLAEKRRYARVREVSLDCTTVAVQALQPAVIRAYAKRAMGERLLINPQGLKRPAEWCKRSTLGREWSAVGGAAGGIAESGGAEDEVGERARGINGKT